jgi:predicted RNA-binding Zn ribbon-like protein
MVFSGYDHLLRSMKHLYLGSHPAADFLNTRPTPRGVPIELIGDGSSYAEWLEGAQLLHATTAVTLKRRFGAAALDAAAAHARDLREWARAWIGRWRDAPDGDYRAELRRLNQLMARATCYPELAVTEDGLQIVQRWRLDSADASIAVVAAQLASLVANEQPAFVKRCAGPGCTLWYVDRTKAHSRLFCSAAACGNRAKVAAFRERQQSKSAART